MNYNKSHKRDRYHAKSLVPTHNAGTITHTKVENQACNAYGQSDEGESGKGEKIEKSLFTFAPACRNFGAASRVLGYFILYTFHCSLLKISHRHDGNFIYPCHHDDEYRDTCNTKAHNRALFLRLEPQQKSCNENIRTIKNSMFSTFLLKFNIVKY